MAEVTRGYICVFAYNTAGKGTLWHLLRLSLWTVSCMNCRDPRACKGQSSIRRRQRHHAGVHVRACMHAGVCYDNQGHPIAQLQKYHLAVSSMAFQETFIANTAPGPAPVPPAQALSCCSFKLRWRQEKAQHIPSGWEWLLRV